MLEIEPWQLYPMPSEQVGKIRGYVERRERLAAERAVRYLTVYVERRSWAMTLVGKLKVTAEAGEYRKPHRNGWLATP